MKKFILALLFLLILILIPYGHTAPDNTIAVPNSFSANTVIKSSDTNSNNNEIQSKYNAHTHTDVTSLGTVTAGTWNATILTPQYGGTGNNWSATAQGGIPYFSAAGTLTALPAGATGRILRIQGVPLWDTETVAATPDAHQSGSATGSTSNPTTNSASFVDLNEMSVTMTTGANPCLVLFTGELYNDGANDTTVIVDIDGVDKTASQRAWRQQSASTLHIFATTYIETMTAASHTWKIQWKVSGGTSTANSTNRSMQVIELLL